MKVASAFNGRWTSFFATTFSIEPEFFDEYLFRRLGEPPLNATILADGAAHSRLWSAAASGGDIGRRLRRANRDYLLRPVFIGNAAFHPKTFLFGNATEGRLLVGSGNLTLRGVERGHEVFSAFRSTEPEHLSSIRGWCRWMDSIVERVDDEEVSYRWHRLRIECKDWLEGGDAGSMFIGSGATSILDQFADDVDNQTDELHLMAPFYDRDAIAVKMLVERFRPRRVHVYLGAPTSVSGPALAGVLSTVPGKLSLHEIDPPEFVHAKLVGVVNGDQGRLLVGSANLSQAAMLGAGEPWANVEACIRVEMSAREVRQTFQPPDCRWREVSLERISQLEFGPEETAPGFEVHLGAAWLEPDGRVTVRVNEVIPVGAELTTGADSEQLEGTTTRAPLGMPTEGGVLVWLRGADGTDLSNRVPLDDRTRLRSWLEEPAEHADRPRGLDTADFETPIGQMLLRLHETSVFDIDETHALGRAGGLTDQEVNEQNTTWEDLEELLAKEELARDPRIEHYRYDVARGLPEDDDVLALLRLMLARSPAERGLRLVGGLEQSQAQQTGSGTPWTPLRRLQVRLFNVLQRWSLALSDPRFIWIDLSSPVRNYGALLVADTECWEQGYLAMHRVVQLVGILLGSFIRTDRSRGYLLRLSEDERRHAIDRLPEEARALGTALVYCSLRAFTGIPPHLFDFQPAIAEGLELGVFQASAGSCDVVARLMAQQGIDERPTAAEIDDHLLWAATYIDDERWSARQERDLGFERVRLTSETVAQGFGITLEVVGERASLDDVAVVSLVRQALAYRKTDGAIIRLGDDDRLSVKLGDPVWALVDNHALCSPNAVDDAMLVDWEQGGTSFAQVLVPAEQAAS